MLTHLAQVGSSIKARRTELGLSQAWLAKLTGLTRQTINGLENGTLNDLGFNRVCQVLNVIGLNPVTPSAEQRRMKSGLWMAAKTAGVSYKSELSSDELARTLATGSVSPRFVAHVATLLEEAPIPLLVMAVEEAAKQEHVSPQKMWKNVSTLADTLNVVRNGLFQ